MIAKGLIKSDNWKQKLNALMGLAIIVGGSLAEDEARDFMYELTTGNEPPERSVIVRALLALPSTIPIIGMGLSSWSGRAEIPMMRIVNNLFAARSGTGKGIARSIEAAATLYPGVPGTSTAFDIFEKIFLAEESKGRSKRGRKRRQRRKRI